ncbi:hypothetical protein CURTO8I2_70167 [Curtobacterium sp. 8I-2]|nr:hypothetical protein CURTO8I2_70167 [Curtobacterium sp. 8I-2]
MDHGTWWIGGRQRVRPDDVDPGADDDHPDDRGAAGRQASGGRLGGRLHRLHRRRAGRLQLLRVRPEPGVHLHEPEVDARDAADGPGRQLDDERLVDHDDHVRAGEVHGGHLGCRRHRNGVRGAAQRQRERVRHRLLERRCHVPLGGGQRLVRHRLMTVSVPGVTRIDFVPFRG